MIGGLQPCSFIDFPGCLSAVVFLRGCNLRCPYCHNPELLDGKGTDTMGETELLRFLAARRGQLDAVVFSGGEPTLQPDLRSLIEAARAMDYKIKLDTNGTRPEVLAELLGADLLDYVALDLKDEPGKYASWLGVRGSPDALLRSLDLVKSSGVDHELRTTVVQPRHDTERLRSMATLAHGARRWLLQPYVRRSDHDKTMGPPTRAQLEQWARLLRVEAATDCRCR